MKNLDTKRNSESIGKPAASKLEPCGDRTFGAKSGLGESSAVERFARIETSCMDSINARYPSQLPNKPIQCDPICEPSRDNMYPFGDSRDVRSFSCATSRDEPRRLALLKTELDRLKKELHRTRVSADENEQRLSARLQEMENTIREHNNVLVCKEKDVRDAKQRNKDLQDQIHDLQQRGADHDHVKEAHDKLKAEHDSMYLDIMRVQREKCSLEEQFRATKHRATEMEMKAGELEHEKRTMEAEGRAAKRAFDKDLNNMHQRTERKIGQLQDDLKHQQREFQELSEKYRSLKREHEAMLPKSNQLGDQLQSEMNKFQQKMTEMMEIHISHLDHIKDELKGSGGAGGSDDEDSQTVWEPSMH